MPPRNVVVFDVETQKSFSEVGKSNLQKLKISVLGLYDYQSEQYKVYEEKELIQVEKRFQEVELIVGFNIRRFDMPVLQPYFFSPIENFPVLDLLDDIETFRGHRASLESIAVPTLGKHKSGSGRDAITLFKENRIEELKSYCLDDVRLTKEIYDCGCRDGKILFTSSRDYKTYEIPVNWKQSTEEIIRAAAARPSEFPTSLF